MRRETRTVDISPTKEFKDGRTNNIIGKLDNTLSLLDKSVPEKSPITELIRTITTDSLKIFLK